MSTWRKVMEKPVKIRHVQRAGSDPIFQQFRGRSLFREEMVHLSGGASGGIYTAFCGVSLNHSWDRLTDCYPTRMFKVCGKCLINAYPVVVPV